MDVTIENSSLAFSVKESDYNKETLYKCFYWYGGFYDVTIDEDTNGHAFFITLIAKDGSNIDPGILSKIKQDLIDFKLRDIVGKETKAIRELLIAKAFSNYVDSDPESEVSDPVGFSPSNISEA